VRNPFRSVSQVGICALAFVVGGCEQPARPGSLVQIDSIVLRETLPEQAIHRPNRIYVADDGEILVSDFTSASVLRFGPHGDFLSRIGRAGKGPGEFVTPAMIAVLDTTILVFDVSQRSAQLFRRTGEYLNVRYDVPFIANDIALNDRSVWATGVSFDSRWSVLSWNRQDGSLDWLMQKPTLWVELPLLGSLGGAHAAFGPGVTWMTFSGVDQAMRWRGGLGGPPDTFAIPRTVRRGIPMDLVRGGDPQALSNLFNEASGTADLSVLPSGGIAILYKDLEVKGKSRTGRYYVTVLDSMGSPTCVDLAVPLPEGRAPVTRLRADTLVVLEQVVPDSGEPTTIVRRWKIPSTPCAPVT
jgi:hypothetical protein